MFASKSRPTPRLWRSSPTTAQRKKRPQFPEQDLGLGARRVLGEQSLALKEDWRRTNSLESTGKMPSGGRSKGKRLHPQLVYRNGDAEIVDTNEKDLVARHNVVVDKLKARWAKQEA
jgi:hypothetical protein